MKNVFNKYYNMDFFSSDQEVERKLFCDRSGFCIFTILPSDDDDDIPNFGHKNIVHRMIDFKVK